MKSLALVFALSALILSCSKNSAPVIETLVAEPDSVYPGDTVTLTFTASDDDKNDRLEVSWDCESGKMIYAPEAVSGEPAQWVDPRETGVFHIRLRIYDLTDETVDSVESVQPGLRIFCPLREELNGAGLP